MIMFTKKDNGTTAIHGDNSNLKFSDFKFNFIAKSIHSMDSINIYAENIKFIK